MKKITLPVGKFSHRRGGTREPEIQGWYFVDDQGILTIQKNPCQNERGEGKVRFYGPIPVPKGWEGCDV